MVSRTYLYLLTIAAVFVSLAGAFFSVTGLVHLFAGSRWPVAVMASSLEFSKFIIVGFIYRYWGHIHRPLRIYLTFAIVVLMTITSIGIFGYLSDAYEIASVNLHTHLLQIDSLEKQNMRIAGQIHDLQKFIDEIPASRISKKFEFQKAYEPKILDLRTKSEEITEEIDSKKQDLLTMNTSVGPIVYLAKALGVDIDSAVKYLILVFVSVFDPLAVSLVFSLNLLIRLREKYRNDEYKIGARSLTNTVDHRQKKAS